MAIFNPVMKICSKLLAIPGLIASPFLCLGVQDIEKSTVPGVIPDEFQFDTLGNLIRARGIEVDELDPFDKRAKLDWNLNYSVPGLAWERYSTVLDYGCIEHIFDTRQVIENCMRMVKVGGFYAIHTPVRNFADHGLHTFSTELFPRVMRANGFGLVFEVYSTSSGRIVDVSLAADPYENVDVIGWYVGRKTKSMDFFFRPEQKRYDSVSM